MKRVQNLALAAALVATAVTLGGCVRLIGPREHSEEPPADLVLSKDGILAESEGTQGAVELDTQYDPSLIETDTAAPENAQTEGNAGMMTEEDTGEEEFWIVPDTESEAESAAPAETETEEAALTEPANTIFRDVISAREALGEHWAVSYEDLESGDVSGYHDTDVMQSASVVKLFIMGAVYQYMCYPPEGTEAITFGESYDGELRSTIEKMITVSDNDAANLLIERLGGGDFAKGAQLIGEFCKENGYTGTSIGRRFMDPNPTGDNYTTAADTRKFLSDIYHGKLVNEEASGKMLDFVKGQNLRNKIPAGLPEGFTCGNKTGEMQEGYNLGCIENDCAIVFPPEGMGKGYVLTVLSNDLGGRNGEAIAQIVQISSLTAKWYLSKEAQ